MLAKGGKHIHCCREPQLLNVHVLPQGMYIGAAHVLYANRLDHRCLKVLLAFDNKEIKKIELKNET